MPKKLNYLDVKKSFEKEGYTLLSKKYKNNSQRLYYVCPNNHRHYITWSNWNHPKKFRCPYCYGNVRYKINDIRIMFEQEGYILLSISYTGINSKLYFICPNGHKRSISLNNWNQGHRCFVCSYEHRYDGVRKSIKDISDSFEKEGYKLLSNKYKNAKSKLDYICSIGHTNSISWDDWLHGNRCPTCRNIKFFGKGNPSWRGGISCEPYCQNWTKEFKEFIKERDGYKCLNPDCWKKDSMLAVHHIDYDKKNCQPDNLVTVCRSCNARANFDRSWHTAWYQAIMYRRYK